MVLLIISLTSLLVRAQSVESGVYRWSNTPVVRKTASEQRAMLNGSTTDFSQLSVHTTTLPPRQAPHPGHKHDDEELVIVKEGKLTISIEGKPQTLGVGSIALIMPGDEHGFTNEQSVPATYYVMRYQSKAPADLARGRQAGGSFVVNWDTVSFKAHDKGGIRRLFDRPTAMTKRFEMHVTTLNEGLWSHPPHTHRAAEILLMKDNSAQEIINGVLHPATVGDVIFLESNVPHAIQNTSKGSCTYFAFQFE